MSERGRSKLFGRPGALLVEEAPPRILMPAPPARAEMADELDEDTRNDMHGADEEPSLPSGPLRVFVGPPSPRLGASGGPHLRQAPDARAPVAEAAPPRASTPTPRPAAPPEPPAAPRAPAPPDDAPGALMSDAVGELGSVLGRRVPPSRQTARGSASDPMRTDLPVVELRPPRRPPPPDTDDDPMRTELPSLDFLGPAPDRASPRMPGVRLAAPDPVEGLALPGPERGRATGIATAAARGRVRPPPPPEAEEEATRIDPDPLQVFERPLRGAPSNEPYRDDGRAPGAPAWDDPRFRKPDAEEISGITELRIPVRTDAVDLRPLTDPTNPGLEPAAANAGGQSAGVTPPAAPPGVKLTVPAKPAGRSPMLAVVLAAVVVGVIGWQWNVRRAPPGAKPPAAAAAPAKASAGVRASPTPSPGAAANGKAGPSGPVPTGASSAAPGPAPAGGPPAGFVATQPGGPGPAASASAQTTGGTAATVATPSPSTPAANAAATPSPSTPAAATAPGPSGASASSVPAAPSLPAAPAVPVSKTQGAASGWRWLTPSQVAAARKEREVAAAAAAAAAKASEAARAAAAPPAIPPAPVDPKAPTRDAATPPGSGTTNAAVAAAVTDRRSGYQVPVGLLQVVCDRKATIYVDNVRKGSTADNKPIELPAGTHRVRVVANGYSRTQEVRVDPGQLRMVQFRLR